MRRRAQTLAMQQQTADSNDVLKCPKHQCAAAAASASAAAASASAAAASASDASAAASAASAASAAASAAAAAVSAAAAAAAAADDVMMTSATTTQFERCEGSNCKRKQNNSVLKFKLDYK
jgi:hypothetical protein